jgi:hypothetical protein
VAKKGTTKALSVEQEDFIARHYRGKRSASSGAADNDQGDVRCPTQLIECKMTGAPGKTPKKAKLVREFEKIADEAWSEGRTPMMALRYFDPDSTLASRDGWVDLAVRLVRDDGD